MYQPPSITAIIVSAAFTSALVVTFVAIGRAILHRIRGR